MNQDSHRISAPVTKVATAWGAVGVTSAAEAASDHANTAISKVHAVLDFFGVTTFAELASYMAFIYTSLLITEWVYKKIIRNVIDKIKAERGI